MSHQIGPSIGRCHDTGWKYSTTDHQEGRPRILGTWVQNGVQCEACHGPGKKHALSGDIHDITRKASPRTEAQLQQSQGYGLPISCGECHTGEGQRNAYRDPATPFVSAFDQANGTHNTVGGHRCHVGVRAFPLSKSLNLFLRHLSNDSSGTMKV